MKKQNLTVWALICGLAGFVFLLYVSASLAAGGGQLLMPLDDVYIHFQYARQLALGQPYIYNPGQPPTSGATSFLYPFLLAFGHLIGFQGLPLGLWAMALGAFALVVSLWAIYLMARQIAAPLWVCILILAAFALNGATAWHYMSGMETGIMCCCALWVLLTVWRADYRGGIVWASLLALVRPEGSMMAVLALGVMLWGVYRGGWRLSRRIDALLGVLPIVASAIQPLLNGVVTGSPWSTGNQAKSLLSLVPRDWNVITARVVEQFGRMLVEFASGYSVERALWYVPLGVSLLGLGALVVMLVWRGQRRVGLLLATWFVLIPLAIATLDTAFWHFKRYQMPLFVLLFPLAMAALAMITRHFKDRASLRVGQFVISAVLMGSAALSAFAFARIYALNVHYVYEQPYQMAQWLASNTPQDAVVAVHDVGLMRYVGGRTTLDMVGLTTPDAADAWRNGPGSVAQFLLRQRPQYIASYGVGHGYGLGTLAVTRLFGEPLATFAVSLDAGANVALAGPTQAIYRPDWQALEEARLHPPRLDVFLDDYGSIADFSAPVAIMDVGDVYDERAHRYQWRRSRWEGFPSEFYELDYVGCSSGCSVLDAVRRMDEEESFVVALPFPAEHLLLVTRVQAWQAGTIDIYANERYIATRWIPQIPGRWLDLATVVPLASTDEAVIFRIVPHGFYLPSMHAIYRAEPPKLAPRPSSLATYQSGAIILSASDYRLREGELAVDMTWFSDGSAQGDYRLFLHLYDALDQPPLVQTDTYIGGGALPIGNWLGGALRDTITLDTRSLSDGSYTLVLGFYEPNTGERLMPTSNSYDVLADGRLVLGKVDIVTDGR